MLRRLHSDTLGAVLGEFAVILLPLFLTFFGFLQLAQISTAHLVMKHSAIVAARAAAVISSDKGTNPGDNGTRDDIKVAAALALSGWYGGGAFDNLKVDVADTSSQSDPYAPVNVTVTATYNCRVPLGNSMLCGAISHKRELSAKASYPHQGANYK